MIRHIRGASRLIAALLLGWLAASEADVTRGGRLIADSSFVATGYVSDAPEGLRLNAQQVLRYVVTNTAEGQLGITGGVAAIALNGAVGCTVAVTQPPTLPLGPGAFSYLLITVTPTAADYRFNVSIPFDDLPGDPYTWTVAGTATAAGAPIAAAWIKPDGTTRHDGRYAYPESGYDNAGRIYGLFARDVPTTKTVVFENVGGAPLVVTGQMQREPLQEVSSPSQGSYTLGDIPLGTTLAPGAVIEVPLTVTPPPGAYFTNSQLSLQCTIPINDATGTSLLLIGGPIPVTRANYWLVDAATTNMVPAPGFLVGPAVGTTAIYSIRVQNRESLRPDDVRLPVVFPDQGALSVANAVGCEVSVVGQPTETIAAGAVVKTSGKISLKPTAALWSFDMLLRDNSQPVPLVFRYQTSGGRLRVVDAGNVTVASGSTYPAPATAVGATTSLTFIARNSGSADLAVSSVAIANATNCIALLTDGLPAVIPFRKAAEIDYDPLTTVVQPVAAGPWSYDIRIASADPGMPTYSWKVSGTAAGVSAPDLAVEILDANLQPLAPVAAGGIYATQPCRVSKDPLTNTPASNEVARIQVRNRGTATLAVTSITTTTPLAGATLGGLTVANLSLAPGATKAYVLRATVTKSGALPIDINLSSNDPDQAAFSFRLTSRACTGHLQMERGAAMIGRDSLDLIPGSGPVDLVYTIRNYAPTGTESYMSALTIEGPISFSTTGCTASVVTAPPASIAPGATGTCTIRVTPSAADWLVAATLPHSGMFYDPSDGSVPLFTWRIANDVAAVIDEPPQFTVQPSSTTIALGATATFTAAVTGSPTPTLQWYFKAPSSGLTSPIPGATGATLAITDTTATYQGSIVTCVATNRAGTATSAAAVLTITTEPPALPGDLNGDGVVNALDLALVVGGFGQAGADQPGDGNGDGVVNAQDLALVVANFGRAN
jgi:hypothetical protein